VNAGEGYQCFRVSLQLAREFVKSPNPATFFGEQVG
jgi:hypothetical protein